MVEAVAFMVDKTAASARERVLFEDGDFEAGFCESSGGCYAAYACAWWEVLAVMPNALEVREDGRIPITTAVFCRDDAFSAIVLHGMDLLWQTSLRKTVDVRERWGIHMQAKTRELVMPIRRIARSVTSGYQ